jgi:Icc protein
LICVNLRPYFFSALAALLVCLVTLSWGADSFRFAVLGDRTGEAQPGVYEQVWREVAAENPAFVVSVGDTIEGLNDAGAEKEWQQIDRLLRPYRRFPLYLTPGNHDIWSAESERLFREHSGHAPHYSFDHGQAHFTVLDNSRSDELPSAELSFLEQDLKEHAGQPVKFILMHRPSWLMQVALRNPEFPLHQLARGYGVRYVIAGHVHQIMHAEMDSVTYLAMPSAGGHLRNSKQYEDGWLFGHALVEVHGTDVDLRIEELKSPRGEGRVTRPADWTLIGLAKKSGAVWIPAQRAAGGSWSAGMPAR